MWARSYRDLDVQMKSLGTMRSLLSWTPPITGYAMSFGNKSVFKVETRAMLEGLFLAWDKRVSIKLCVIMLCWLNYFCLVEELVVV
ncbi:hypothetical protein Goklo_022819 [Gossypium klotzschianum]|uniref:Uncharacterized protein n=1 Tax=Gossypium klotzschianum TaxID=34286 RepID=A0A7J8TNQ8_9ROSI|nr:hypothetical protein [Gossypium klotzschianum]